MKSMKTCMRCDARVDDSIFIFRDEPSKPSKPSKLAALSRWRGLGLLVWRESIENTGEAPWRLCHDSGARSGAVFNAEWESQFRADETVLLDQLEGEAARDYTECLAYEAFPASS